MSDIQVNSLERLRERIKVHCKKNGITEADHRLKMENLYQRALRGQRVVYPIYHNLYHFKHSACLYDPYRDVEWII